MTATRGQWRQWLYMNKFLKIWGRSVVSGNSGPDSAGSYHAV